ncbi:MAG: transglycosylase SLT domain-containing protein [Spirochaetia bacterium]|nr:transglycosylase SLT domain-containing protein [Spirochaetia bacterium]
MILLAAPLLLSFSMIDPGKKGESEKVKVKETAENMLAAENQLLYIPGISLDLDVSVIEKQMYRNIYTKKYINDFYAGITGSENYANLILQYADKNDLPYSFVFALVWNESRFINRAVNYNKNSVDRGLFQLNSLAFPELTEKDFFKPETNIVHGTKHLKWCLDTGGNEIVALAMYNAGRSKVERNGTPRKTLDYISGILEYQNKIEKKFKARLEKSLEKNEIAYLIH